MDLACFSDDSFKVVQWINCYFKNNGRTDPKDVMVASLVSRLQIYVEQINFALEKSSHHLIGILPLLIKDIGVLQAEIEFLTNKIHQHQTEIGHVQNDTCAYMAKLERTELVFQKLHAARHGMQESDGWGKLIAELDELLERNDIFDAKDKFTALRGSILAQNGLPGQMERELQFEYFTNRFEALVSPVMIQSFQTADIDQCLKFVNIFKTICRLPQMKQCYKTVHKNLLLDKWTKLSENAENYNILSDYYDILLNFVQNQQKWCRQVFMDGLEPIDTVCDVLTNLQFSRESFVAKRLKMSSDKFELLADISKINNNFASAMDSILMDQEIPNAKINFLSAAIYQYFDTFVEQYPNFETTYSIEIVKDIIFTDTNVTENVRILDITNAKTEKWIDEALQRCITISQNRSLPQTIKVIRSFLRAYIEKYEQVRIQLTSDQLENINWHSIQLHVYLLQYLGDVRQTIQRCEKKISENNNIPQSGNISNYISTQASTEKNNFFTKDLFAKEHALLQKVAIQIHDTILKLASFSVEKQFKEMEFAAVKQYEGLDLPDYSYAPQEYITQIGQYLLTLPQHLEPLLLNPTTSLKAIMEICVNTYSNDKPCADVLLALIVEETTAMYQEKIDDICTLSVSGAKQLAVDIEYFGNVLEEIGLPLSTNLQHTVTLLRAPLEQYNIISGGCNPRLVTTIRQKRNIMSC